MGAVLGSVDDVPGSGAIAAFLRSAPPRSSRAAGPCASQCAAIAERRLIGVATGFTAPTLKAPSSLMSSRPRPPAIICGPAASLAWPGVEEVDAEFVTASLRGPSSCRCRRASRCRTPHRESSRTQLLSMS